jgi:uncharacterized protein (DUF58 family)
MDRSDPTTYRRLVVALVLASAVLGLRTGSPAFLGIASAFAFLLVQAFFRRGAGLAGLRVRRQVLSHAFEGDVVEVELVLENTATSEARLLLIADSFGPGLVERQVVLEPGPLPGQSRRTLRYRAFCTRRFGAYAVGPLTLSTTDPLGLFAGRLSLVETHPLTVYPRVDDVAFLDHLGGRPTFVPEALSVGRRGQSALCLGIREYEPGDDLRSIHWPATARRGLPMMRQREADLRPRLTLFVDLHRAGRAGIGQKSTLDYLVRVSAATAWTACRTACVFQVLGEGGRPLVVPPGDGERHLAHALSELIQVAQDGTTGLADLVHRSLPHLHPGGTVVLVGTDAGVRPPELADLLEELRAAAMTPVILLMDTSTFAPLDHLSPLLEARARRSELLGLLRAGGARAALLDAGEAPLDALRRPDLFDLAHAAA